MKILYLTIGMLAALLCLTGCNDNTEIKKTEIKNTDIKNTHASVSQKNSSLNSQAKPLNVLYIMTDDHAAHAVGAYEGRFSKLNPTPNIDKLANEGMLFSNAFVTNSICTPSRASILTGQYSQTNGVLDLGRVSFL